MLKTTKKQPVDDINEQLRKVRESELKVTFGDIWQDYKNYRQAYYFSKVFETPKETYQRQAVQVDLENFTLKGQLMYLYDNRANHQRYSPNWFATQLAYITFIFVVYAIVHVPYEWYYEFKDPYLSASSDDTDLIDQSAESTMRRLKYKKKVNNWL